MISYPRQTDAARELLPAFYLDERRFRFGENSALQFPLESSAFLGSLKLA
jgi:hypothetical protein